jgi:hypothetical protein
MPVAQHKGILDTLPIHIGAIVALQVFNHVASVAAPDDGMAARDAAIILKHHIAAAEPPNCKFFFVQPKLL